MTDEKKIGWGVSRFSFDREDVELCVKTIEANKGSLSYRGVSTVSSMILRKMNVKHPNNDNEMFLNWVEQIIHLFNGQVKNIPDFMCEPSNPYLFRGGISSPLSGDTTNIS